jgi:hypothetical protein
MATVQLVGRLVGLVHHGSFSVASMTLPCPLTEKPASLEPSAGGDPPSGASCSGPEDGPDDELVEVTGPKLDEDIDVELDEDGDVLEVDDEESPWLYPGSV